MTSEQFDRELLFQISVSLVEKMLKNSIISSDKAEDLTALFAEKYNPPIGRNDAISVHQIVSNKAEKTAKSA